MKYVITGAAGHISKPLTEKLLSAGHEVTVIGRNADHLKPLVEKGAKAATGTVEDVEFLTAAFRGADAVYTMIPPDFGVKDWKGYIAQIGRNYTEAVRASGVKYVVNLSSVGAHMQTGCGPVSGLFFAEQSLNSLEGVTVVHLRPGYFFYNFFSSIPLVKQAGIIGSNFGPDADIVLSDTEDIASFAAEELLTLRSKGHLVRYVSSDVRKAAEVAKVFGTAIGNPELPWVSFKDEDSLGAMLQAGLPEEIAKNFVEMGAALAKGEMTSDYFAQKASLNGQIKAEDFAKYFAAAYNEG
jgi:uncharacterized protein YbjT (DUF2867 family)